MVWSVFDVVCGSGMVHLSILGGNQPRFGEPTDPESTLPSLVGSVTLAQPLLVITGAWGSRKHGIRNNGTAE